MRGSLALVSALLCFLCLFAADLRSEPPKPPPPTAAQRERLKERDRYGAEAQKLRQAGKLPEAIAAAEKMLAIEREVFGNFHEEVAGSLEQIAEMQEQREDFAGAPKARQEVLAIRAKLHGDKHWRVTDARLALTHVDLLAKLKPEQRRQLNEANQLNRKHV